MSAHGRVRQQEEAIDSNEEGGNESLLSAEAEALHARRQCDDVGTPAVFSEQGLLPCKKEESRLICIGLTQKGKKILRICHTKVVAFLQDPHLLFSDLAYKEQNGKKKKRRGGR